MYLFGSALQVVVSLGFMLDLTINRNTTDTDHIARHSNAMHAKPDLRVVLKWKIAGSCPVIADVIQQGREDMLAAA